MTNNITSQEKRSDHAGGESICKEGRKPIIRIEDLPRDVLYNVVSKLPTKEFARTSVLSSRWRCMWPACPRLTFDSVSMCKCDRADLHQHIGKFIHEVNAVLQKHHGMVVETLEVRVDFVNDILVNHLNNWIRFAGSSLTKNLTLDLKPKRFSEYNHRYAFPFTILDNGSISRLRQMRLSFVSLKPPSQFKGFPNLRKLHMQLVHVSRRDLEHVLSHCCFLEWLHIDRCNLDDELRVDGSLSHLQYLHVEWCKLNKIKFHAVNLSTFKYEGRNFVPIDLSQSFKLQSATIHISRAVFQHVLTSLLNGLPSVESLTLRIDWQHIEKQWLWDNPLKFSHLRHFQLFMMSYSKDIDRVLYLVSFLRATPFIEKLEVHFAGFVLWLADVGPRRQDFGQCQYNYLKNMCVTGFKAARGQVEFLLHVVENAPALEVLTVNTHQEACVDTWPHRGSRPPFKEAGQIARTFLSTALPQNVKFHVI